tara:strand:+ start:1264 stop:1551 length:288 start_codon:yes stop_codon:yes gene_type:complete
MKILNGKDTNTKVHFGKGGEDYTKKGTSLWELLVCIDTHRINYPNLWSWVFETKEDAERLLDHIKNGWDNPPLDIEQGDYACIEEVSIYSRKEEK